MANGSRLGGRLDKSCGSSKRESPGRGLALGQWLDRARAHLERLTQPLRLPARIQRPEAVTQKLLDECHAPRRRWLLEPSDALRERKDQTQVWPNATPVEDGGSHQGRFTILDDRAQRARDHAPVPRRDQLGCAPRKDGGGGGQPAEAELLIGEPAHRNKLPCRRDGPECPESGNRSTDEPPRQRRSNTGQRGDERNRAHDKVRSASKKRIGRTELAATHCLGMTLRSHCGGGYDEWSKRRVNVRAGCVKET
jgi:hypothetical protein